MSKINRRQLAFADSCPQVVYYREWLKSRYWTPSAIDFSKEKKSFEELPELERTAILRIQSFFGTSDGIVNKNISDYFLAAVQHVPEIAQVYQYIATNELIHSETYARYLRAICDTDDDFEKFLDSSIDYPAIREMHDWIIGYMNEETPLAERIIAFGCFEGIMFADCFAYILDKKNNRKGDALNGLIDSNEYIANDEGLHTDFAITVFHLLTNPESKYYCCERPSEERARAIIQEAVRLSTNFIHWVMSGKDHRTITLENMKEYAQHTANVVSGDDGFGYGKIYNVENPFSWMIGLNLQNKTNFFEHHSSEYVRNLDGEYNLSVRPDY